MLLLAFFACAPTDTDSAGPPGPPARTPDEAAPTVKFLSPEGQATVSGTVAVEGKIEDDKEVTSAALLVDDERLSSFTTAPWLYSWDTTLLPDGPHRLQWTARDHAGNADEAHRLVYVQNGTIPLDSLQLLSPAEDATVCGSVTVDAYATSELAAVTLYVGGNVRSAKDAAPFRWTWDTAGYADGAVELVVLGVTETGAQLVDRATVNVDNAGACDLPPEVTFTAPALDAWVEGTEVPVSVDVTDDGGEPVSVAFDVDGTPLDSLTVAPWSTTWDSTGMAEGSHLLTAVVTDSAGHTTTARTRAQVDTSLPRARLTAPSDGDLVNGTVVVTATVEDTNGLVGAELAADGVSLGTLTTAPWAWPWNSRTAAGDVKLTVTATDLAGHRAADSITVTVDNPPRVEFVAPADGDVISGNYRWTVSAEDDSSVEEVTVDVDGSSAVYDRASPYRSDLYTCEIASGAHVLTATAVDDRGQASSASVDVVIDQSPFVDHVSPSRLEAKNTLTASVADDVAVTDLTWTVDGVAVGSTATGTEDAWGCAADCANLCTTYTLDYDATSLAEGSHVVVVAVTDADGVVTTDTVNLTVDHDYDGDGHSGLEWGGDDCDDDAATIAPGAAETCDGLDQDCDGEADEDFDADADGWLDADACSGGGDCDDADPAVNPAATEVCDGVDDDCDGYADVSAAPLTGSETFGTGTLATTFTDEAWGNVYVADRDLTLTAFAATFDPGSSATRFAVYEGESTAGPFTRIASASVSASGGYASWTSPALDVPLSAGKAYLLTIGSTGTTGIHYERSPSLTAASGLTPAGGLKESGGEAPATATGTPSTAYQFDQVLSLSWTAAADTDADRDGETPWCGDCDDTDPLAASTFAEACDGVDNDCDGVVPADESDADADGAYVCDTDCDDTDADRSPFFVETCDGVDNDCDGEIAADEADADGDGVPACETCVGTTCTLDCADDDPTALTATRYEDADSDGYGDSATATAACPAPRGWVLTGGDCDDTDAAVSPGAAEVCNAVDDDCDGTRDDGFDGDGDGVGACEDCDDADATVSPEVAEVCGDEVDDDCSGAAELCRYAGEVDVTGADVLLYGDARSDALSHVASADITGDGVVDGLFSTPLADNGATSSVGALYVIPGPVVADGSVGAHQRLLGESASDQLGTSFSARHDLDGDGEADLLAGATGDDDAASSAGAAYVIPATSTLTGSVGSYGWKLIGERANDGFGGSIASLGDLDGDGAPDLAVGAAGADGGGSSAGAAYVFSGPILGDLSAAAADAQLLGEKGNDGAETVADGGDLDGDGLSELLVGASGSDAGIQGGGSVYIVSGPVAGGSLSSAVRIEGKTKNGAFGLEFATGAPADLDGDGRDDLVLPASADTTYGSASGSVWLFTYAPMSAASTADADVVLYGESDDGLGSALSLGDADADGHVDLLVGASTSDRNGSDSGAAFLVYGPVTGASSILDADATLIGESAGDKFGDALILTPDLDGDGGADLWLVAPGSDLATSAAGAAWLFTGGP